MEEVSMAPPPPQDRVPYESGSAPGGKLKARRGALCVKRTGTPYERPVVGRHASAGPQLASALSKGDASAGVGQRGSWFGAGIADSASRILTRSAAFVYSSLFKRQAPAITAAPTVTEDTECAFRQSETPPEDVPPLEVVSEMGIPNLLEQEENINGARCVKASDSDTHGMHVKAADAHLENLLKQRDLTREQCERYIKLIESRVVGERDVGTSPSNILLYSDTRDDGEKVRNKGLRSGYANSKEDRENQGSSPVDVAMSHMYAYSSQSPMRSDRLTSGASRTPGRPIGPRASAIPPREPHIERQAGEFISRWTPIQVPISGGRELLKRRTSVLDDRCSLPGAARRTNDNSSTAALELRGPSNATHKGSLDSEANLDLSCFRKEKKKGLSGMEMSIPRQSARTARKILDTLERRPLFKEQHSGKFALVCQGSRELEQFSRETTNKDIKVKDGFVQTSTEGLGLQKSIAEGILTTNVKSFRSDTANEDYDELKTNAPTDQNVKCVANENVTNITSSRSSRKRSANPVLAPVSASRFASSGFTFPSSGSGPEPPTPKPMPSPYSTLTEIAGDGKVKLELSRENLSESRSRPPTTASRKNTALSSLDKVPSSFPGPSSGADVPSRNAVVGADAYDMQNLVARADKASSMLATTYGATSASLQADFGNGSLITSPTISDNIANHLSSPSSNCTTSDGPLKFGSANGFRPATGVSGTGSIADKGPFSSPSVNPFGAFSAVKPPFAGFMERRSPSDAFHTAPAAADGPTDASDFTTQVAAAATQDASSSTPFTAGMVEASQIQFSVGAQSLAPPDAAETWLAFLDVPKPRVDQNSQYVNNPFTQSSGPTNGGFSLGAGMRIDKGSTRRKKSAGLKRTK